MSMISAQCDELRKTADELQDVLDNGHNYTCAGFVVMVHHAQQELCDAADTIWELRCKLAGVVDQQDEIERLRAENAKLREDLEDQEGYDQMLRDRLRQQTELCVKAEAENEKLRELVRDMFLIVACMDLDGSQLHTHGVDADWRTLRERYDELMGYEGEVDG